MTASISAPPLVACHVCGIPLLSPHERIIGCCSDCIAASQHTVTRIPRPGYASSSRAVPAKSEETP